MNWLKEIEERLDRNTRPRPLSQESGYETAQHNRDISTLLAAYKAAKQVLEAYEQWEADLIEDGECWDCQYPAMNEPLYDRWMELQTLRNEALSFNPTKQKEVI